MGKNIAIYFITFLIAVVVLPAILVRSCKGPSIPEYVEEEELLKINVYFHKENKLKEMYLEEYIVGVVAGEMPASFDIEALKAQAVIARTYAVARMRQFGGNGYSGYPQADISTDYAENQHYVTEEEAKSNWSFWQKNANWEKITEAVYSTMGEIITYEGTTIDALYHSTCGGATEDSEDVFTNAIPYLRGKECSFCKDSSRFNSKVTYTKYQLGQILQQEGLQHVIGATKIDMEPVSKTNSDRVIQYRIGDKIFRGNDVRMLFKLDSARFTYKYDGNNITFTVVGYGHGVGMCQYGANGMAKKSYNYKDIINFYYTSVEIANILEY
ncbi:stage II sporulation protein D [Alkalicella caledoniensis]|uniref:Stage II sporulation protein D n=1 Tax=Alkalicella caledoniensis TaxID=2731377 RepID=A0A7G9W917_ALKCA|nr:stage II sporulation protein D [Alkalicella caledoniensis]QNO15179.1 stage II sporulation protein D [Alkalicella caledoniensis]